jgi:hypothetical protein
MKIRTGFVSNSSSSSFVVISKKGAYIKPKWGKNLIVDHNFGGTEFGWGPGKVSDIGSKIIFCYLQAQYVEKEDWIEMLEEVIKENTKVSSIEWKTTIISTADDNPNCGYIDHGSNSEEDKNTEIFSSKKALRDFIFNDASFIILDNDNH